MTAHKTYRLDFLRNSEWTSDSPERVEVEVTQQDVEQWLKLAQFIKEEGLLSIEQFDRRCSFYNNDDRLMDESDDFSPEFMRVQIESDTVEFLGGIKNSDDETWLTSSLELAQLAADLGIDNDEPETAEPETRPTILVKIDDGWVAGIQASLACDVVFADYDFEDVSPVVKLHAIDTPESPASLSNQIQGLTP